MYPHKTELFHQLRRTVTELEIDSENIYNIYTVLTHNKQIISNQIENNIEDYAITKYVIDYCKKPIDFILSKFDFLNPIHGSDIMDLESIDNFKYNLSLIRILANSFELTTFRIKNSLNTNCDYFLTNDTIIYCSELVNQLILDNYNLNDCTYNKLINSYPELTKYAFWAPYRLKFIGRKIEDIIKSMFKLVLDTQSIIRIYNKIINDPDIKLYGTNAISNWIDPMNLYSYKLVKDLVPV